MHTTIQILLCLFAVIGALFCIRCFSDYIWTQKLITFFCSDSSFQDSDEEASPKILNTSLTVKLSPGAISSRNSDSLSDDDIQYLATYFETMLSRTPLGDFVEEIVFTDADN